MARRFGNNKFLQIAHNSDQTGLGALTMVAWYQRQGPPGSSWGRIFHKARTTSGEEYGLITRFGALETLQWRVNTDGTNPADLFATSAMDTSGVWRHCAGTWDGTTSRVYFNGVEQNSTTGTGSTTGDSSDMSIGAHNGSPTTRYTDGDVCECGLWDRALSLSEINAVLRYGVTAVRKNLLVYVPVNGNPTTELETINARTVTHTGSPAKSDHAPIAVIGPAKAFSLFVSAPPGVVVVSDSYLSLRPGGHLRNRIRKNKIRNESLAALHRRGSAPNFWAPHRGR